MAKNPDPTDRVRDLITERAPIWTDRMGLSHFEIDHVFLDSFYDDESGEDFKVTATTESRWQYLQAKVKWYLPSAVRHDDDTLERVLVHELCHVLLAAEQTLIDTVTHTQVVETPYVGADADALWTRNYELLELATEMCTRAVMAGWTRTPN